MESEEMETLLARTVIDAAFSFDSDTMAHGLVLGLKAALDGKDKVELFRYVRMDKESERVIVTIHAKESPEDAEKATLRDKVQFNAQSLRDDVLDSESGFMDCVAQFPDKEKEQAEKYVAEIKAKFGADNA